MDRILSLDYAHFLLQEKETINSSQSLSVSSDLDDDINVWKIITVDCRKLVKGLMEVDPEARIDIKGVLGSAWISLKREYLDALYLKVRINLVIL